MWKLGSLVKGSYCEQIRLQSSSTGGEDKLVKEQNPSVNAAAEFNVRALHKPNKIDKWLLVWDKKYKTFKDVPNFVSNDQMEKARNWARIKISTYLMIATAFGCIAMVYSGKRAAARGESVTKANLEWHKRNKEEAEKENQLKQS